jgi:ACT domain-containing protein
VRAVLTVIGRDKKGVIYRVSKILFERGVNILDISQTILQEMFTMILLADVSEAAVSFSALAEELAALGAELHMQIQIQREDIFNAMHRV